MNTEVDLDEFERVLAAMTPGPSYPVRIVDALTPDEMVAAVRRSIESSPGTTMFGINAGGDPGTVEVMEAERCIGYTGNGPTSEANAIGLAYLHSNAVAILAELRRRRTA